MRKQKWRNKAFCTSSVHRWHKFQLQDGGVFQDMSAVAGYEEFITDLNGKPRRRKTTEIMSTSENWPN